MYRQSEKNLLSSNISPTSPHNMVNFGPLAAEILSLVWGTPANFSGFRVLAALLHGTLALGVSQTAVLNRGRHRYWAGRPSRWALAHISSWLYCRTHQYQNSLESFFAISILNPNYDVINDVISGFAKVIVERCGFHPWIAQRMSCGEVVSIFLYFL